MTLIRRGELTELVDQLAVEQKIFDELNQDNPYLIDAAIARMNAVTAQIIAAIEERRRRSADGQA